MKISLSARMLLLTLGSFLLLIFGIIASLYLYFNRFYEPEKINQMINAIDKFTYELENSQWTDDQLYSEVSKFMKNQNVTMSIQPQLTQLITAPAQLVLKDSIPDYFVIDNKISNTNTMSPLASVSLTSLEDSYPYATVSSANINGSLVLYPAVPATVYNAITVEIFEKKGVSYTISNILNTNYRQVNFIKQSTLKNGEVKITSVNLSLQSVDEVTNFLIRFFPFLISASILLSIIMVFVYSRTISKPIISITKTANRMANMELGISSDINRSDELGALSSSLNTLSINLKNSLDDLSLANTKLTADYEKEICQEKARKEFVANVSHELKTPLGIIRSYTEGIRDGVKSEKKEHYMEVILNEITHMDQMILEMLEISRYDAGAVTYQKRSSDVKLYIDKSVKIYSEKALDKGVSFRIPGEFGSVMMDEKKIQRAINNLIENAVKYCTPNSVIRILGERSGNKQKIEIENYCAALSEEALSKIWDRFYKTDTSHNRDIDGTGLGLSIVKSILEGHGCSYGVHNTDHGICFSFVLDIAEHPANH
jgi:signal transduction histidine kinase